jgi:hypothetical protein
VSGWSGMCSRESGDGLRSPKQTCEWIDYPNTNKTNRVSISSSSTATTTTSSSSVLTRSGDRRAIAIYWRCTPGPKLRLQILFQKMPDHNSLTTNRMFIRLSGLSVDARYSTPDGLRIPGTWRNVPIIPKRRGRLGTSSSVMSFSVSDRSIVSSKGLWLGIGRKVSKKLRVPG